MKRSGELQRRQAMARKTEMLRRTPMRRTAFVSRRRKPDIPRSVRRAVQERSGDVCELRLSGICWGRATQMDHIKNRSQGAGHEVEGLQHLCVPCHEWKTTHPNEAEAMGAYKRSWQ